MFASICMLPIEKYAIVCDVQHMKSTCSPLNKESIKKQAADKNVFK